MNKFRVRFLPQNVEIMVEEGTDLLEAQIKAGLHPDAPCGGKGTCGKEDEAHGENIFVTYAGRSKAQLLHKAELFVLQEGYD